MIIVNSHAEQVRNDTQFSFDKSDETPPWHNLFPIGHVGKFAAW